LRAVVLGRQALFMVEESGLLFEFSEVFPRIYRRGLRRVNLTHFP
jgi:hypothetical protein